MLKGGFMGGSGGNSVRVNLCELMPSSPVPDGALRVQSTDTGRENAESMASVGVSVEPKFRLGREGTVLLVQVLSS